jgi:polar amino acid transport system substrate-binding protein
MTLSAAATPERLAFAWAEPYLWARNMVLLRKDVGPNVRSIADFMNEPSLRLGVVRGFVAGVDYEEFVTQLRNIGRVEEVDDANQMYAMLRAGRFQAVLSSQLGYASYLKDEIASGQVRVEDWGRSKVRGTANLLVSKKSFSPDDARRWGELLKSLTADGTITRLVARYVDHESALRMTTP